MNKLKDALSKLAEVAGILGLNDDDVKNAEEYLVFSEYALCFDIIITQMYEYDITIDKTYYELIFSIAKKMKMDEDSYLFMKELIRNESCISSELKEALIYHIKTLS